MKKSIIKTTAITITAILALSIVCSIFAIQTTEGHTPPWTIQPYAYISVSPNPIGVGQQTLVVCWVNVIPYTANDLTGDVWHDFKINITTPSGETEVLGPFDSDSTGSGYRTYTPTEAGNYTFVFIYPEQIVKEGPPPGRNLDYLNDTVLGAVSEPFTLTVQKEPIDGWSEPPLPTEYWSRPLNKMNRGWYAIASNWLAGASTNFGSSTLCQPYGDAPESAHIVWTKEFSLGGITDGRFGSEGYYTGISYESYGLTPPIILDGKLYYMDKTRPIQGWYCVDLYTGETLYFQNTTGPVVSGSGFGTAAITGNSLAWGQIMAFDTPNQHGTHAYLWTTAYDNKANQYNLLDAFTGDYLCTIANVSTGSAAYGLNGEILRYRIDGTGSNQRLLCWNSTYLLLNLGLYDAGKITTSSGMEFQLWRPVQNRTYDGTYGYSANVSIPDVQGSLLTVRSGDMVIGGKTGTYDANGNVLTQGNLWALNINQSRGNIGTLLWNISFTPPAQPVNATISMGPYDTEDGVFFFDCTATQQRWGYSLATGQLLWGPSERESGWNVYGMIEQIYQGKLLSYGYSGEIIAYDAKTGQIVWIYEAKNVGFESPYGNYPLGRSETLTLADGKIYTYSTEHSATEPLWRGSAIRCINASNGIELWKIWHWGDATSAVADGYLVSLNSYDGRIYCYGKGASDVSVSASPKTSTYGNSVLIEGTVIDISAGTKENEQANRFPDGVPAVSDDSMTDWMQYVYMQQSKPYNVTGVPVTLSVIDSNGNYREIGSTTSDADGYYSYVWTPDIEGKYTLYASFAGSKSYYPSHAVTAFNIASAPPATAEPPAQPRSMADIYFLPMSIGIITAIIIVGALLALLLLRKRP